MHSHISAMTVALGLGLCAVVAHASSTAIFKAPIGTQEASKSKRFAINPELGRAWVEIDIYHDRSQTVESHRVAVPGLTYNPDTAQIVFTSEGHGIVCANVHKTGVWLFKHQRIEPTGECELTRQYVKVPVDDGFAVQVLEHFEVHFKPSRTTTPIPGKNG